MTPLAPKLVQPADAHSVPLDTVCCRFKLNYRGAEAISVVGTFNGWSTGNAPMKQVEPGRWEAELRLPTGYHRYSYFVLERSRESASGLAGLRSWLVNEDSVLIVTDSDESADPSALNLN